MSKIRSWIGDLLSHADPRVSCTDLTHDEHNLGVHFGGRWGRVDHMTLFRVEHRDGKAVAVPDTGIDVRPPDPKMIAPMLL